MITSTHINHLSTIYNTILLQFMVTVLGWVAFVLLFLIFKSLWMHVSAKYITAHVNWMIPTLTFTLMLNQLSQKYIRTILRREITHYLVPLRIIFPCGDVPTRWHQVLMFSILCCIENCKICPREQRHKASLLLVAVSKMRTLAFIELV